MYAHGAKAQKYIYMIGNELSNRFQNTTKRFLVVVFLVTVLTINHGLIMYTKGAREQKNFMI
jgi:hypothetical protein